MGADEVKPRLADVASRAGVSRTTASYIVNGHSARMRISEETVVRVRRAVAELGYRPNGTARSLRTARTRTVGLVSDSVASGHAASPMLTGASTAAREAHHLLVIGETDGDPLLEQEVIEQMIDQGVDGIVYASRSHREVTLPEALLRIRTVLVNCEDREGRCAAVVPDDHGGGRLAGDLVAAVPGAVVVLGDEHEQGTRAGRLRLAGLVERLAESERGVDDVVRCAWTVTAARHALGGWWDDGGRAAVVVCLNDRVAMGAYQALAARGLRVPTDVAVVAFDGSELARWLDPPLTSIGLPFLELGAVAVRMLLAPAGPAGAAGVVRLGLHVAGGASIRTDPDRSQHRSR